MRKYCGSVDGEKAIQEMESSGGETTSKSLFGLGVDVVVVVERAGWPNMVELLLLYEFYTRPWNPCSCSLCSPVGKFLSILELQLLRDKGREGGVSISDNLMHASPSPFWP